MSFSTSVPVVHVAVAVAIVLVVLLVTTAVTCGVIVVLRSRHHSDRKIGVRDVILCEWSTYTTTLCVFSTE